ncbi:unnamed protein product [Tuber melanosporum]|uniref:(Perigord truffle) hypothetical protein n=1 Tax=Tuber melanosporum (strain Mel28) TaxID=656061 RepID=D5G7Y5_TUBMM|nr:uncharacterized protein GSTUM_00002691001 [Tuber melanosporum]CAZ80628.1 unnamed protein product [Tuber melanosporum]
MDGFILRCNDLRCRAQTDGRAVVTTCSGQRTCPACDTTLSKPDDAVITVLNPSDDYKTSVLSGLSPSIIIEICTRGLAFWTYQVTQEMSVFYQEHLAKSLRARGTEIQGENEKIIRDANDEISALRNKIAGMRVVEDELRRKNHELLQGWREKARKLAQTQELYDKLKRRTLISQVQQAATDQADQALYMTSHQPSDSRYFQDSLNKSAGNFSQQIQPSLEPEYTLTGAKIRNTHAQGGIGPGGRAGQSLQRPGRRPDDVGGMFLNDQTPFSSTPITGHEHRQRLDIQSSAIRFPGAQSEYGRPPLRGLNENTRGGRMGDGGKNRRLEVDENGRVVLDQH